MKSSTTGQAHGRSQSNRGSQLDTRQLTSKQVSALGMRYATAAAQFNGSDVPVTVVLADNDEIQNVAPLPLSSRKRVKQRNAKNRDPAARALPDQLACDVGAWTKRSNLTSTSLQSFLMEGGSGRRGPPSKDHDAKDAPHASGSGLLAKAAAQRGDGSHTRLAGEMKSGGNGGLVGGAPIHYRNPKNRKLYTSIGAYSSAQGVAQGPGQKAGGAGGSIGATAVTSVSGSALSASGNHVMHRAPAAQAGNTTKQKLLLASTSNKRGSVKVAGDLDGTPLHEQFYPSRANVNDNASSQFSALVIEQGNVPGGASSMFNSLLASQQFAAGSVAPGATQNINMNASGTGGHPLGGRQQLGERSMLVDLDSAEGSVTTIRGGKQASGLSTHAPGGLHGQSFDLPGSSQQQHLHNSIIIQREQGRGGDRSALQKNAQGASQVKRNTSLKQNGSGNPHYPNAGSALGVVHGQQTRGGSQLGHIHQQQARMMGRTQVGNYVHQQPNDHRGSKEYLENSFHIGSQKGSKIHTQASDGMVSVQQHAKGSHTNSLAMGMNERGSLVSVAGANQSSGQGKQQRMNQKLATLGGSNQKALQSKPPNVSHFDVGPAGPADRQSRPHSSFKAQAAPASQTTQGKRAGSMVKKAAAQFQHQQYLKEAVRGSMSLTGVAQLHQHQQLMTQSGRRGTALIMQQPNQLSIGADGMVGIPAVSMPGNGSQQAKSGSAQRKNKHLAPQVNYIGKNGKMQHASSNAAPGQQLVIGKTQRLQNQLSVYQNQMVTENNVREPRRGPRGSSHVDNAPGAGRGELLSSSCLTKEQREMRTSSANAAMTGTEFALGNLAEGTVPKGGYSGTALQTSAGAAIKLQNHNVNYQLGGTQQQQHLISGISAISGGALSNGAISVNTTGPITLPQNGNGNARTAKGGTNVQASKNNILFNSTSGSHKVQIQKNGQHLANAKASKRNFKDGFIGMSNDKILLQSTNKSLNGTGVVPEQLVLMQNIDSIRSGRDKRSQNQKQQAAATAAKNRNSALDVPASYLDGARRQGDDKQNGGRVASKSSVRQSFTSGPVANSTSGGKPTAGQTPMSQAQVQSLLMAQQQAADLVAAQSAAGARSHQQSLQNFLQQQMIMQNNQNGGGIPGSAQPKNGKKAGMSQTVTAQRQQKSSQAMQAMYSHSQTSAHRSGPHGKVPVTKSSGQKLTKKQITEGGLLTSERHILLQIPRDAAAVRKGGTQTAIGIGVGSGNSVIMTSQQPQTNKAHQLKSQAQSMSRSRISQGKDKKQQAAMQQQIYGKKMTANAIKALAQLGAQTALSSQASNSVVQVSNFAGTPGMQSHAKKLMASQNIAGRGDTKELMRPAGRNYYSQIQNTKNSNKLDNRLQLVSSSSGKAFEGRMPGQSTGGKVTTITPVNGQHMVDAARVASNRQRRQDQHMNSLQLAALQFSQQSGQEDSALEGFQATTGELLSLKSPSNHMGGTQHQTLQIQIAEQAVEEMRRALYREDDQDRYSQQASPLVEFAAQLPIETGSPSMSQKARMSVPNQPSSTSQSNANAVGRPKSQNDVQNYTTDQDTRAAVRSDSGRAPYHQKAPGSTVVSNNNKVKALNVAEMFQNSEDDRLWSQDRRQQKGPSKRGQQSHGARSEPRSNIVIDDHEQMYFAQQQQETELLRSLQKKSETPSQNLKDEIDEDKFHAIISNAFDKIIGGLHPRVGNALRAVKSMYTHLVEQIEQNHESQLQIMATQMQEETALKDQERIDKEQSLRQEVMQLRQKLADMSRASDQRTAKYALAERLREGLDDSGRRDVSRGVIDDMKRNLEQHRPLRGAGGLATTGSGDPLSAEPEGPLGIQDGSSSMEQILEGLPDFDKNQLTNNAGSHVRISRGEIFPNQPIMIGDESREQPRVESRLEHRTDLHVRRGFEGDLTEDEVMDPAQISSITRYELAQTVNVESTDAPRGGLAGDSNPEGVDSKDKPRPALSDDRAMEFDEEDDDDPERVRDGQQSYFSSRVHSSSDTINSEILLYQDAIRRQTGNSDVPAHLLLSDKQLKIPGGGLPLPGMGTNGIHDASPKVNASKIVPSLDFVRLQSQNEAAEGQAQENNEGQEAPDADEPNSGANPDMSDVASSSLADYEEMIKLVKDIDGNPLEISSKKPVVPLKKVSAIPGLNLGQNNSSGVPPLMGQGGGGPSIGLDLSKIGKDGAPQGIGKLNLPERQEGDFQDEFMARFDEFSESWRMMILKQKRF